MASVLQSSGVQFQCSVICAFVLCEKLLLAGVSSLAYVCEWNASTRKSMCVFVASTRLHAQKHLWHKRGESSPAAAQEDAQQHTARTLRTLQNRSRVSRTGRVLTRQAKTGIKKQQPAGEHPAGDPPGTAHHCVRAKHNPRRTAARRVRVQPPKPQPAPAPAPAPTKTPPHTRAGKGN